MLASVLPKALAAQIAWDTLELESPETVDAAFDRRQADLVFRARVRDREARLLLVFEHQSRVDPAMPVRLLAYMARVWERCLAEAVTPLPVVIPVVLYHGDAAWTAPRRLSDLLALEPDLSAAVRPFVPDFAFALDDLTRLTERGLRARALSPWATMALALLAWCRGARHPERVLLRWLDTLRLLQADADGLVALTALATYLLKASAGRVAPLKVVFARLGAAAEELIVTPEEEVRRRGRREGRAVGRQEGREEGRRRGLAELLVSQLVSKFGPLTPAAHAAIEAADEQTLVRWGVQLLTADSLARALD